MKNTSKKYLFISLCTVANVVAATVVLAQSSLSAELLFLESFFSSEPAEVIEAPAEESEPNAEESGCTEQELDCHFTKRENEHACQEMYDTCANPPSEEVISEEGLAVCKQERENCMADTAEQFKECMGQDSVETPPEDRSDDNCTESFENCITECERRLQECQTADINDTDYYEQCEKEAEDCRQSCEEDKDNCEADVHDASESQDHGIDRLIEDDNPLPLPEQN